ncbi:plasmid maintenance system killer protein [Bradyrhizobium lablabi]|uniref:plasmid maintenance system killer protein n=1 Tax=Bradyrhizobium lablabi TaxID=722472 RepID=UPI001FCD07CC|nr:plasmid maintenance system killer protein [Bradyrhizobium lablabi]
MIRSWRNSAARKVWDGERPNQFRGLDFEAAVDLLLALNVAKSLGDLSPLKSVGLHKLKGDRRGQWGDDSERPLAHLFRISQGRCARGRNR